MQEIGTRHKEEKVEREIKYTFELCENRFGATDWIFALFNSVQK